MRRARRRLGVGAVVLAAIAALPRARAQADVTATTPAPYLVPQGTADGRARTAAHMRWADLARAAGEGDDARRHLAMACHVAAMAEFDVELEVAPCPAARAQLAVDGPVDARILLLVSESAIAGWRLDIPRALGKVSAALELGAAMDVEAPEAMPVRFAHFVLGAMLLEGGHYDRALAELSLVQRASAAAGDPRTAAYGAIWLCRAADIMGDRPRAAEHCAAAARFLTEDPDAYVAMNLAWIEGELAYGAGQLDDALAHYRRALELATMPGGQVLRPTMRVNVAATLIALGRTAEARPWLEGLQADLDLGRLPMTYAPQVAEQWGELALAVGDLADAGRRFELAAASPVHWLSIRTHGRLADVRVRQGDLTGARAALVEAIRRIETERATVDGSLQRTSFMALHAAPYRELAALVALEATADAAARALEVAEAGRARALRDALDAAAVPGAAPPARGAADIQAQLGDGELLIEYVIGSRGLLALAVDRATVRAVPLPGAGAGDALAARVGFFRALVSEARGDDELRAAAAALYGDLLAPVLAVAPHVRTVIIAPDGPLHEVPFDALLSPAGFLVDTVDVALAPSAALIAAGRATARPAAAALVVAAPPDLAGLGVLRGALDEAAAVRRRVAGEVTMLAGDDASESRLDATDLERYAVLHFASHAQLDAALPLRSALVLAPGRSDEDGRWRAEEIYARPVRADVVVLSACSTAVGAPAGGEGVMSLARAFLHAGAGATVATLWDVDDATGAVFSDELYRRAAAGESLGAAVAGARRALRRGGAPPRAWAGYVLTGAPGRRVAITAAAPATGARGWLGLALGGAAVAVLGVLGVAIARRPRS